MAGIYTADKIMTFAIKNTAAVYLT